MAFLTYRLRHAPDLSLVKYQALEDNTIDGLINRHNDFLRQWNRITILAKVRMTLAIQYLKKEDSGSKMQFYLVLYTEKNEILPSLEQLIKASPLSDYFFLEKMKTCEECPKLPWNYSSESILKKIERKRSSDATTEVNSTTFYSVSGWESSDEGRLRDTFRIMDTLDEDLAYTVSLEGIDAFKLVSDALEKPITYLRKKTSSGNLTTVSLSSSSKHSYRDVAAEETLNDYEKFITAVTESPCFKVNIRAFSNTKTGAELLLAAATGEAINEGNAEIVTMKFPESLDVVLKTHMSYSKMLPPSLNFWPTLFTLEELSPFFRFPILLEGEYIGFPKETQSKRDSVGIPFGKDSKNSEVSINPKLLKKHAFVCGVPGAGKTNTMLGLCYNIWKKFNIPFLVLEPAKKEYRALAQTDIDKLIVFSPSSGSKFPLAINPFQFPEGMSLAEHIQNLMGVFEGAFPLTPPLPALLDRSIEAIYLAHGWDTEDVNSGMLDYPTMTELYNRLEEELKHTDYDGEVRGNMKSALEMRIGSLLRRDLGNVFDVPVSTIKPQNWIKYPIIIELESLGSGPANFLTLMLCTLIREVLRIDPNGDADKAVRHVMFIEEAHNLIAPQSSDITGEDANPKAAATSYIVKMLAEVRALREGIVIADQLPTAMAPEILKNTTLKVTHRMTSQDDRKLIGSTMAASGVQLEEMATYMPGETLIYYEGLLKPFKLRVNLFEYKDAPDNDTLFELMKNRTLHQAAMTSTIQSRLVKLQMQWIEEWKITTNIYDLIINDCNTLLKDGGNGDLNAALKKIVSDQCGMDTSLKALKQIVKRYRKWSEGMVLSAEYTDFLNKSEKDIAAITYYVRKKLTETKF